MIWIHNTCKQTAPLLTDLAAEIGITTPHANLTHLATGKFSRKGRLQHSLRGHNL
jgi:hypothetical protein